MNTMVDIVFKMLTLIIVASLAFQVVTLGQPHPSESACTTQVEYDPSYFENDVGLIWLENVSSGEILGTAGSLQVETCCSNSEVPGRKEIKSEVARNTDTLMNMTEDNTVQRLGDKNWKKGLLERYLEFGTYLLWESVLECSAWWGAWEFLVRITENTQLLDKCRRNAVIADNRFVYVAEVDEQVKGRDIKLTINIQTTSEWWGVLRIENKNMSCVNIHLENKKNQTFIVDGLMEI